MVPNSQDRHLEEKERERAKNGLKRQNIVWWWGKTTKLNWCFMGEQRFGALPFTLEHQWTFGKPKNEKNRRLNEKKSFKFLSDEPARLEMCTFAFLCFHYVFTYLDFSLLLFPDVLKTRKKSIRFLLWLVLYNQRHVVRTKNSQLAIMMTTPQCSLPLSMNLLLLQRSTGSKHLRIATADRGRSTHISSPSPSRLSFLYFSSEKMQFWHLLCPIFFLGVFERFFFQWSFLIAVFF